LIIPPQLSLYMALAPDERITCALRPRSNAVCPQTHPHTSADPLHFASAQI
jgi:hypothetical protein